MAVYEIKRGDRRPYLRYTCTVTDPDDPSETPAQIPCDLTDAVGVRYIIRKLGEAPIVDDAGTFIDRVNGVVQYAWASGDTDVSGTYNVEVEIDWGAGEKQSFPSTGYETVIIFDDLG
jgi:hypothetical protein